MPQTPLELLSAAPLGIRPTISLSEGSDPRVVAGALAAKKAGIADVILVGSDDQVRSMLLEQGWSETDEGVAIHDPTTSELTQEFANSFHSLRKHKGTDAVTAFKAVQAPLVYAAMLVREGHADGTLSGAVATTSEVVRTALQVIGKAHDSSIVSSFFLMFPPKGYKLGHAMLYSDCGLIIDPSSDELVSIAVASAKSFRALMQTEPKIAMLSFSTKGSAKHARVTKVIDAVTRLQTDYPELQVDGELQFDAALVPDIAASKAPRSEVAGEANVMIFPNLDAGNIGYKITQRLGAYAAIGPILQGLAKPANDLSRGCVAEDVTQMIAVTA